MYATVEITFVLDNKKKARSNIFYYLTLDSILPSLPFLLFY